MTASPWAPPSTVGAAVAPVAAPTVTPQPSGPVGIPPANYPGAYQPVPQPPRGSGPRLWPILAVFSVIVIAAIGITALVTASIVRSSSAQAPATTAALAAPQYSAAEVDAAKQNVCHVFDVSSAGKRGKGGVVVDGQPNLPVILRTLTSAVAVQNALAPALPADVATAAHKYVTTTLDLATGATGSASLDEINRLTTSSNDAAYSMADVCGLPR